MTPAEILEMLRARARHFAQTYDIAKSWLSVDDEGAVAIAERVIADPNDAEAVEEMILEMLRARARHFADLAAEHCATHGRDESTSTRRRYRFAAQMLDDVAVGEGDAWAEIIARERTGRLILIPPTQSDAIEVWTTDYKTVTRHAVMLHRCVDHSQPGICYEVVCGYIREHDVLIVARDRYHMPPGLREMRMALEWTLTLPPQDPPRDP